MFNLPPPRHISALPDPAGADTLRKVCYRNLAPIH